MDMHKHEKGIIAIYEYLDHVVDAIKKMKGRPEFRGHELYSPTSYHEIEHAYDFKPSPVRYFTLIGALTGTCVGFALPLIMDYDWPLVVGGKTAGIFSLPAYVIIGFELTILLGAIATILGMLVCCKIPNPKHGVMDARLSDSHFGVFVPDVGVDSEQAKILRGCGAIEVNVVGEGNV